MHYPLISVIISWGIFILIIICFIMYVKSKFNKIFNKNQSNYNSVTYDNISQINNQNNFDLNNDDSMINGTDEVDKQIIKTLKSPGAVLGQYSSMLTSTNIHADLLYDDLNNLIEHSDDIYDDLKRNRETFNSGSSHSNLYGIPIELRDNEVNVNIAGYFINLTLNELKNLTIDALKGKINDNLILSHNAFDK